MEPTITVGNVFLPTSDLPEQLTFGGDLLQTEVELSDGSTYLSVVGTKWVDLTWSACLYATTSQGTPLQRAKLMQQQWQQAQPLTVVWQAEGVHERIQGTITAWHWQPVRDDVQYDITIHRSTDGGLMTGGVPRPPSATRRRTTALTALTALSTQVGPQTAAAMQAATERRISGH